VPPLSAARVSLVCAGSCADSATAAHPRAAIHTLTRLLLGRPTSKRTRTDIRQSVRQRRGLAVDRPTHGFRLWFAHPAAGLRPGHPAVLLFKPRPCVCAWRAVAERDSSPDCWKTPMLPPPTAAAVRDRCGPPLPPPPAGATRGSPPGRLRLPVGGWRRTQRPGPAAGRTASPTVQTAAATRAPLAVAAPLMAARPRGGRRFGRRWRSCSPAAAGRPSAAPSAPAAAAA